MADETKLYFASVNAEGKLLGAGLRSADDAEVILRIPGKEPRNFSGDHLTQWEAIAEAVEYWKGGGDPRDVVLEYGKKPFGLGDLRTLDIVPVRLTEGERAAFVAGDRAIDMTKVVAPVDSTVSKLSPEVAVLKVEAVPVVLEK